VAGGAPKRGKVSVSVGASDDASQERRAGRRSALLVANAVYRDSALSGLRSPVQDIRALAQVLGDPQIGGFDVAPAGSC
jgi:hypothetical protein